MSLLTPRKLIRMTKKGHAIVREAKGELIPNLDIQYQDYTLEELEHVLSTVLEEDVSIYRGDNHIEVKQGYKVVLSVCDHLLPVSDNKKSIMEIF